jgi:hypothetical protein
LSSISASIEAACRKHCKLASLEATLAVAQSDGMRA